MKDVSAIEAGADTGGTGDTGDEKPARWLLVGVVLLGALLRIAALRQAPPGLWFDEAYDGIDSLRFFDTGELLFFYGGNFGRETIYFYMAGFFLEAVGARPFTLRLFTALLSIPAIPLTYHAVRLLFAGERHRSWIALAASMQMAVMYWSVSVSRTGYRSILMLPLPVVVFYLFWKGTRVGGWWRFGAAGLLLGLVAHDYAAARMLPFVLVGFTVYHTLLDRRASLRAWKGLFIVGAVSILVYLPLGLYFVQNPDMFSYRLSKVSVFYLADEHGGLLNLLRINLVDLARVFVDRGSDNPRHNLPLRPAFTVPLLLCFWAGLGISIARIRRPGYGFLLINFAVMSLPGILALPAVDYLHLQGIVFPACAFAALGMVGAAGWAASMVRVPGRVVVAASVLALCAFEASATARAYFVTWAHDPRVHEAFLAADRDLVVYAGETSFRRDVYMPARLYLSPPALFLLHDDFRQAEYGVEPEPGASTAVWLEPESGEEQFPPSFLVRLHRDADGRGTVNLSRAVSPGEWESLGLGASTAPTPTPLEGERLEKMAALFHDPAPTFRAEVEFPGTALWHGYDLSPVPVEPGRPFCLGMYWEPLANVNRDYQVFVQVLDSDGVAVTGIDDAPLLDTPLWRRGLFVPDVKCVWLGPETPPGMYLVRSGMYGKGTFERLPTAREGDDDSILVGPLYVGSAEDDPRVPPMPLDVSFGGAIRLEGYGFAGQAAPGSTVKLRLYWRSLERVDADYTVFVQLLDGSGEYAAGADSQPVGGLYPTSEWKEGELVVDEHVIALPPEMAEGGYRLVAGMYRLESGERLEATGAGGTRLAGDMAVLME